MPGLPSIEFFRDGSARNDFTAFVELGEVTAAMLSVYVRIEYTHACGGERRTAAL
jgi:hypothetical protein